MRIRLFPVIALTLFCLLSCGKDTPSGTSGDGSGNTGSTDKFTLKGGVIYFDETDAKYISAKDEDCFVLSPDTPASFTPAVGDIVLAAIGPSTPYGFMGKVLSVSTESGNKEYRTEIVALDEVFEELHLDETIDIAEQLEQLVDEEGNLVECLDVDDSVWEEMGITDEDETKVPIFAKKTTVKSIPISTPVLSGQLILATNLRVMLDIGKGKINNYDISLETTAAIDGNLAIDGSSSLFEIPTKTLHMKGFITVGPIVLRPAFVYGLGMSADGSVKMNGPLSIGLLSATTTMKNFEAPRTTFDNSHPFKTKATYLDCDGSLKLEGRIGFQFGVFSQKVLAFGVDLDPEISIALSGKMDMTDKRVMAKDVVATLSGSFGSLGAYIYSALFSKHRGDKLRVAIQTPEFSYEIPLFNNGENHNCVKSIGNWGISGSFKDKSVVMEVDEAGYALFKIGQEDPLEIFSVPVASGSTKADIGDAVFSISGNPFEYYIRSYNKVHNDDGDYDFFGGIIGNFISNIRLHYPNGFYYDYSFGYDEYGRLTSVKRSELDNPAYLFFTYTYKENEIRLGGDASEYLKTDSYGRVISYATLESITYTGENTNIVSRDYTPDIGTSTYSINFIRSGGNTIKHIRTVTHTSGQSTETKSFTYLSQLDNYSIDYIHSLLGIEEWGIMLSYPPFIALPGFHNKNLLSRVTWDDGYSLGITYSFDENDLVSKVYLPDGTYADVTYINLEQNTATKPS